MATTITANGCIPLMTHGPSAAATNSAVNYRQGFVGAFVAPASGPMNWLSGVLSTTSTVTTYSVDLLPIPLGTPGQGVQVYPGVAVVNRGATIGPYLALFNNTSTISLDAASTTNPRIDVIYVQVNDDAIGDAGATNGAFMAVVNGTPASTPVAPSVPAGAIAIAQIYRNTVAGGGNTITTANITDVRTSGGIASGVRLYLPGDSLTAAGAKNGDVTFDSVTYGLRYWAGGSSGSWHGVRSQTVAGVWANGTTDITVGTNPAAPTAIMSATVADPGFPYKLNVSAALDSSSWGTFTAGNAPWSLVYTRLGSVTGTIISQARLWAQDATNTRSTPIGLASNCSGVLTGPQTVYLCAYGSISYTVLYATIAAGSGYLNCEIVPA